LENRRGGRRGYETPQKQGRDSVGRKSKMKPSCPRGWQPGKGQGASKGELGVKGGG